MKGHTLILIHTFTTIATFSYATHPHQPEIDQSSMINHIHQQNVTKQNGSFEHQLFFTCNYDVTIRTSCSSTSITRDELNLVFRDANHDQGVSIERMNEMKIFKKCNMVKFELSEKCLGEVCKLYLERKGTDGWIPESVTIDDFNNPPVIFNFNIDIPNDGDIHGFNYC